MTKPPARPDGVSRRAFVQQSAVAVLGAPLFLPRRLFGGPLAPSNRIRVAHIGCGRIAQGHDMPGVAGAGVADVLAVCDLDSRRAESGKARVARLYANHPTPRPEVQVYTDWRQVMTRSDVDAVVVSLPDHQHAEVVLAALYAG